MTWTDVHLRNRSDRGTNYEFGKGKGYLVDRATDFKGGWKPNLDGLRGVKRDRNTAVKCATDVTLKIFECKDCSCTKTENGKKYSQLVQVVTDHKLSTASKDGLACQPYFIFADGMIRNMVAKIRKEVIAAKTKKCVKAA